MAAKKHNFTVAELKAGMFVIVSAVILVGFVAVVLRYRPERDEFYVVCYFHDTYGLNKDADVRFGGVKVGRVRTIRPDLDGALSTPYAFDSAKDAETPSAAVIRVEALVPRDLPINKESIAYISQTTLTADKHLEITTGSKEILPAHSELAEGSRLPTQPGGGALDQVALLAMNVKGIVSDIEDMLGVENARAQSEDRELQTTVMTMFDTVDKTLKEGKEFVADARDVLADYRGDIGVIIHELIKIEQNAQLLTGELNALIAENRNDIQTVIQQTPALVSRLDALTDDVEKMAQAMQSILDGAGNTLDDNRPVIEDLILELRDTVGHLKTFARNLSEEPESVIWGKGVKGRGGK
jgi:ABC-type transporter Mla subunit MlaD